MKEISNGQNKIITSQIKSESFSYKNERKKRETKERRSFSLVASYRVLWNLLGGHKTGLVEVRMLRGMSSRNS